MANQRDTLIKECIDITRASNVPMLFLSNPGAGKTTAIQSYAKANNFGYVELDSQNTKEDVTGMYAIHEGKLIFLEPDWYTQMCKVAKKQDVILFIDELSAASDEVQKALLKIIFGRKVKEGYEFPKNVTIVAAANFEENLPEGCGVIGPQLNRFAVISLDGAKASNPLSLIATMDTTEHDTDWAALNGDVDYTDESYSLYVKKLQKNLSEVASNFKAPDDYVLEFDSYSSKRAGVMTTRTLEYLKKSLYAGIKIGASESTLKKVTDGLIGAGFNLDDEIASTWRKALHKMDVYSKDALEGSSKATSFFKTLKAAYPDNVATLQPGPYITMPINELFKDCSSSEIAEAVFMLQGIAEGKKNINWQNLLIKACAISNKNFGTNFIPKNAYGKDVEVAIETGTDGKPYITTKASEHVKNVIYTESSDYGVGQTIFNQ